MADYRNLLIIIGRGSRGPKAISSIQALASIFSERLELPVFPCFLEFGTPSVTEALEYVGAVCQADHVIVLPLFQAANPFLKSRVPQLVAQAGTEWPGTYYFYGTPLDMLSSLYQSLNAAAQTLTSQNADTTALLMVGRGSIDPAENAETYKAARLLWEAQRQAAVCDLLEVAFYNHTMPNILTGIERCIRLGTDRIIVMPHLLFDGSIQDRICEQIESARKDNPSCEIVVAEPIETQSNFVKALANHYAEMKQAALEASMPGLPLGFSHTFDISGSHTHSHSAQNLQNLLPPRYQNKPVSAAPMGAADLILDANNQVAWDEMWQGFCDLAMAGGPPHRGDLLEPVSPQDVAADPLAYESILAELERGIRLVTGLRTVRSNAAGWVGVECTDEAMALWLLRAIIVENISVRREGCILYLPAGPAFRLSHEIKNVITVIAKTHHYWKEHITAAS